MANEITHASLETDVRMADILSGEVRITLADTASLRQTSALTFLGSVNGAGSDTARLPRVAYGAFAAVADGAAPVNTALVDASETIAVVRHSRVSEITDLAQLTARGVGDVTWEKIATMMVTENERGWMSDAAIAAATFSSTVGTTTQDLAVDEIYEAIAALEIASVTGPYWGMLAPRQLADLQTSVRAEGGAAQWKTDHQELLNMKDQGFVGEFLNIQFFSSSFVPTANAAADRAGAIWGEGALGYKTGVPTAAPSATMGPVNDILTVEFQRPERSGSTLIVGHSYYGISNIEDGRGVAVITDA